MAPQQMIDMGLRFGAYGDGSAHKLSLATLREHPHGLDLGPSAAESGRPPKTPSKAVQAAPELLLTDLARFAR